jgi:hypothetical protein
MILIHNLKKKKKTETVVATRARRAKLRAEKEARQKELQQQRSMFGGSIGGDASMASSIGGGSKFATYIKC